jgi:predicted house-cleaning noncanonical NTP pyrophosphatase (MazG superfamily)
MPEGYPIKLVRDRVASIDTSQGLAYRPVADRDEHVLRLRAKLVEEVGE